MRFLPDVNVLFPLLVSRHAHRSAALEWFDEVDIGQVAVCRLTKLGVLRLLCTPQIMGADVLTPGAAIEALACWRTMNASCSLRNPRASMASSSDSWRDVRRRPISGATPILRLLRSRRGYGWFRSTGGLRNSPALILHDLAGSRSLAGLGLAGDRLK